MSDAITHPPSLSNGHARDVIVAEEKAAYDSWRPMIPPELLDAGLDVYDIAVYVALAMHVDGKTGECFPSQSAIAKRLGISRKTVNASIQKLSTHGFIESRKRVADGGGQTSNLYVLPHQKSRTYKLSPTVTPVSPTVTPVSPTVTPPVTVSYTPCNPQLHEPESNEPESNEPEKENSLRSSKNGGGGFDGFAEFWSAYPRHEDKKRAMAKWGKMHPDEATRKKIMDALSLQKQSDQWTREGGRFVPHPTTWLNGERWDDEVVVGVNGNGHHDPGEEAYVKASLARILEKNIRDLGEEAGMANYRSLMRLEELSARDEYRYKQQQNGRYRR